MFTFHSFLFVQEHSHSGGPHLPEVLGIIQNYTTGNNLDRVYTQRKGHSQLIGQVSYCPGPAISSSAILDRWSWVVAERGSWS